MKHQRSLGIPLSTDHETPRHSSNEYSSGFLKCGIAKSPWCLIPKWSFMTWMMWGIYGYTAGIPFFGNIMKHPYYEYNLTMAYRLSVAPFTPLGALALGPCEAMPGAPKTLARCKSLGETIGRSRFFEVFFRKPKMRSKYRKIIG